MTNDEDVRLWDEIRRLREVIATLAERVAALEAESACVSVACANEGCPKCGGPRVG
jgi:hypothetical protein